MKLNIAVLAGDGIGPEIMKQGVAVMSAVAEKLVTKLSIRRLSVELMQLMKWVTRSQRILSRFVSKLMRYFLHR